MNADFVEYLLEEQSNPNGLLLDLLTSGYEQWEYIIAVEGDDDREFYFDYLTAYMVGKSLRILVCGNKDSVLKLKISVAEYSWSDAPKFAYICDKDFDDYLKKLEHGVWYTPGYSIESFLLSGNYIRYVTSKYSKSPLNAADLNRIEDKFEHEFGMACSSLRPFLAYMCLIRATGFHPKFDNFGIDKLFSMNENFVPLGNRLTRSKTVWGLTSAPSCQSILDRVRKLPVSDRLLWMRGKLGWQLAKKCYERVRKSMPQGLRAKMPHDPRFSRDAMGSLKGFMPEIPTLKLYLAAL